MSTAFDAIGTVWQTAWDVATAVAKGIGDAFAGLQRGIKLVWDGITGIVKGAINVLIDAVNGMIRALNGIQIHIPKVGIGDVAVGPFDWNGLNLSTIPRLATGTRDFGGGWAMLGERGPELARLPRGTDVFTAAQSRDLLAGSSGRAGPLIGSQTIYGVAAGRRRARDPAGAAAGGPRLVARGRVAMATLVEWFPADGSASARFTTGAAAPLRLLRLEGTEPVTVEPVTVKSPNQPGATALDVVVPPRVVTLGGLLAGGHARGRLGPARRAPALARPAADPARRDVRPRPPAGDPRRPRSRSSSGRCRAARTSSARRARRRSRPFDLEWLAPEPYWRAIADTQVLFTGHRRLRRSGVEFPLEMTSNNVEVEIANLGDVDAPITARLYGDVTTARIRNLTTGEVLEITGNIAASEYVEVSTAFGDKRVEQVVIATGVRTSVMDRINLAKPDFWALRPGLNVVTFEADVNVSRAGRAVLAPAPERVLKL